MGLFHGRVLVIATHIIAAHAAAVLVLFERVITAALHAALAWQHGISAGACGHVGATLRREEDLAVAF